MQAGGHCYEAVTIIRSRFSNCWMAPLDRYGTARRGEYSPPWFVVEAIGRGILAPTRGTVPMSRNGYVWPPWRIISGMNEQGRIEIIVNGDAVQIRRSARVTDLIEQLELASERLAIELNLSILPRAKWAETELRPGDRLEIVHFVGGG